MIQVVFIDGPCPIFRVYGRGVQPVHRSGARRAKKGPVNLWRALYP